MASSIPQEQPPVEDSILREWLARMMMLISSELERVNDIEPINQLPDHIVDGMVRNFSIILLPDIPAPGPYIVIGGIWVAMT